MVRLKETEIALDMSAIAENPVFSSTHFKCKECRNVIKPIH